MEDDILADAETSENYAKHARVLADESKELSAKALLMEQDLLASIEAAENHSRKAHTIIEQPFGNVTLRT